MHVISEVSVQAFRAEILLTSTLRHPTICSLHDQSRSSGMNRFYGRQRKWHGEWGTCYGRSYYGKVTGVHTSCVLHRDLKPENALITEWLRAKVSDVGTSRTLDRQI